MSKIPIKSVVNAGPLKLGQFKLSAKRVDVPKREDDPYRRVNKNQPLLIDEMKKKRTSLYDSILTFPFNMNRMKVLSEAKSIQTNSKGLLYWMSRLDR
jgi:hypothetical protein